MMNKDDDYWYLGQPYSKWARKPDGLNQAFHAACVAQGALTLAGVRSFSPIAHTHPVAMVCGINPLDHAIWMPADRPMMVHAMGLIIYTLEGWSESVGLAHEIEYFEGLKKPVVYMATPDHIPPELLA